jgi:hypothetical protein
MMKQNQWLFAIVWMALLMPVGASAQTSGSPGAAEPAMHDGKSIAEVDYMVIHPDDFGQHWCVRFQIIPVLPALFKDTLF